MRFNEYQAKAAKFDLFPRGRDMSGNGFVEKVLGLVGEAGEAADKFKKILRDKNGIISNEDREALQAEFGDVLWYLATLTSYLGLSFDDVAQVNIKKLEERRANGVLHGEGDNR